MVFRREAWRRTIAITAILMLGLPAVAQSPELTVERLQQLFTALELATAELPRDSFDPQAIVDEVGTDPEALFTWVRDNTYFVPYEGVLRGPVGVLLDRRGNSLDRALLLRDLLARAGHDAILAVGSLDDATANRLLNEARSLPMTLEEAPGPEAISAGLAQAIRAAGMDFDAFLARVEESQQEAESLQEEVRRRIDEQVDFLAEITEAVFNQDAPPAQVLLQESITEHWWVEIQTPTAIIDLDPSLPGARVGNTLTSPSSRFSPTSVNQLRGLPDTAHTFILRAVIERWEQGELSEEVVFEHELFPAEIIGQPIIFSHLPVSDPEALSPANLDEVETTLLSAATDVTEWQPILWVGSQRVMQKSFTTSGEVKSTPGGPAAAVGGMGGNAGGMFGGFGGALGGASETESSFLTAEWLEYEIRVPGASAIVIRRQIFDVLGPSTRSRGASEFAFTPNDAVERGLSLIGETEILPVVSHLSTEYVAALTAGSLLANRQLLIDMVSDPESLSDRNPGELLASAARLPGPLFDLVLAQRLWNPLQDQTFPNQVAIYTHHQLLGQAPSGEITVVDAIDIVHNGIGVQADSSSSRQEKLRHGVRVTNAEAMVLGAADPQNTAEMLARSWDQGISWALVTDTEQTDWQRIEIPADVRARIEEDLRSGQVVVVPERGVQIGDQEVFGWWRVDPVTGLALGMGEQGWGQGKSEYIFLTRIIAQQVFTANCLIKWGRNSSTGLKKAAGLTLCVVAGNVGTARIAIAGVKSTGLALGLVSDIIGGVSLGLSASL